MATFTKLPLYANYQNGGSGMVVSGSTELAHIVPSDQNNQNASTVGFVDEVWIWVSSTGFNSVSEIALLDYNYNAIINFKIDSSAGLTLIVPGLLFNAIGGSPPMDNLLYITNYSADNIYFYGYVNRIYNPDA